LISWHIFYINCIKAKMASEDKTYCGRGYTPADDADSINQLIKQLGVSREDIFDAIELVGNDKEKVEEYFRSKENSY
jgi:hypothetical protein